MQYKVSVCCGTRPEVIKMAPLIHLLRKEPSVELEFILTGQHTDLLDGLLDCFDLRADIQLSVQSKKGDLNTFSESFFQGFNNFTNKSRRPNIVLVHGDTATSFNVGLYCFHQKIPFAHVEAGLRSGSLREPFPEEFYRQSLSKLADLHFCPDKLAQENLLKEGVSKESTWSVGNTIEDSICFFLPKFLEKEQRRKEVLVTLHRRETRENLLNLVNTLLKLANKNDGFRFVFIEHPASRNKLEALSFPPNFVLEKPLVYPKMLERVAKSWLVITDSAGLQEEAQFFGTAIIICRKRTERKSSCILVGTDSELLENEAQKILSKSPRSLKTMKDSGSPSEKICSLLLSYLKENHESISHWNTSR